MLEWFVVELGLQTGLRVFEMVALRCGDILLDGEVTAVFVRRGKFGKSRIVRIGPTFTTQVRRFLDWKKTNGEPTGPEDPLFVGRGGRALAKRSAQAMVSRVYAACSIANHRTHDLRHTYASHLLHASGGHMKLVQKQLGHEDIRTTQGYADVLDPAVTNAVSRLYMDSTVSTEKDHDENGAFRGGVGNGHASVSCGCSCASR